jgi:beta-glucosidase
VRARNELQRSFVDRSRLGIPVSFVMETLHSGAPGGTIFPSPSNFGASWNESAMAAAAEIIAVEARGTVG